jgi:hypothetical protein
MLYNMFYPLFSFKSAKKKKKNLQRLFKCKILPKFETRNNYVISESLNN